MQVKCFPKFTMKPPTGKRALFSDDHRMHTLARSRNPYSLKKRPMKLPRKTTTDVTSKF